MKISIAVVAVVVLAGAFSAYGEEKELIPTSTGFGFAPEATGGPDAFGYTWSDQVEPNCAFGYIDISATGTDLGDGDDVAFQVTLGIGGVDFYGTTYTDVYAVTNGFISTDNNGGDVSPDCPLPAPPSTGAGARMYALHDDLDVDPLCANCAVYWQYFPVCPRPNDEGLPVTGCDIIQWIAQHFPGGAGFPATEDFEIIIYETREIVVQVALCAECGEFSTTGIQDDTATIGLTYACDTPASVPSGTAVCFFHPNPVPVELMNFDVE